jgi:phosphatidylserine synthase
LAINTNNAPTKAVVTDLMRTTIKNQHYRLKKKYFNGVPANEIRTTSPVGYMSDAQWRALVAKWTDPKNMVCVSCLTTFFQYHFAKDLKFSTSCSKHVKITSTTAVK